MKDTGIGIEPYDLERIFAPFEQVESSISRKLIVLPGVVTALPGKRQDVDVAHSPDGRLAVQVLR